MIPKIRCLSSMIIILLFLCHNVKWTTIIHALLFDMPRLSTCNAAGWSVRKFSTKHLSKFYVFYHEALHL